jgi:DNA-binding IclR family transcriptional regulator
MSGVGVLDKAVTILAACVDGASLAELVERTKLPRATAHRLAQALEIHRMLVRDAQGRWRPGPRLGELANAAPDILLTAAEPILTALRDATCAGPTSASVWPPPSAQAACATPFRSAPCCR